MNGDMFSGEKLKWREQLLYLLLNEVERQKNDIFKDAEYFWSHPEIANHEVNTSNYLIDVLQEVGLAPQRVVKTGVYADSGNQITKLGIIADMDGIEVDGSVRHACGHHAQLTHLLGVARVLTAVEAPGFHYGVRFIAAPAEELGRSKWRDRFLRNGEFISPSGKMCMFHAGVFRPIQALISCHLADDMPDRTLLAGYRTNGCITVTVQIPDAGMSKFVQKVIREFQDAVKMYNLHKQQNRLQIRFDMSGLGEGFILVFLYGSSDSGANDAGDQGFMTDSCLIVQNLQMKFAGDSVRILNICDAYEPLIQDDALSKLVGKSAQAVGFTVKNLDCKLDGFTDLGFLSKQIAVCHPLIGGTQGVTHTSEFRVIDPITAYILPIRMLLEVIVDYYLGAEF